MKIKGWELMKKIADGEIKKNQKIRMIFNDNSEVIFIFDGADIINDTYINIFDIYEMEEILRADFELIQDEIIESATNSIKGIVTKSSKDTEKEAELRKYIVNNFEDIRKLIQAVKQLNKKLEEK